jgi:NAD(P)-dependent dehydrogenase (short-subunit alcohol dehydrogenase family)
MSKVVIITGASRGIGAGIARVAGRAGWDVCVNYHQSRAAAEAVVADVEAAGSRAIAVQADASVEADIGHLFETAERELGAIASLVNNAGILTSVGRLDEVSYEDVRRIFEVNSVGPFICAREAVRRMSTKHGGKGGTIVNVASAASTLGSPNEFINYAGSKAAIDALTLGLSKEVAKEGIRVNAVSPGFIDTDIHYEGRWEKIEAAIPLGRKGTAEETGEAVLWLMDEKSSYITGAFIRVAGGR